MGGNLAATTDANNGVINLGTLAVNGTIALATNGSGNATVVNDAGLDFAASTVGGTLSATATTGNIADSGALTIAGAATFITGVDGSDIILDSSANAFSGSVTFQADAGNETFGNITFVDSGAVDIDSSISSGETNTTADVTERSAGASAVCVRTGGSCPYDPRTSIYSDGGNDDDHIYWDSHAKEFKYTNNIRSFLTEEQLHAGFTANSAIGVRDRGNDAQYGADPFIVQIKVKDGSTTLADSETFGITGYSYQTVTTDLVVAQNTLNYSTATIELILEGDSRRSGYRGPETNAVNLTMAYGGATGQNGDLFINAGTDGAVGGNLSITATTGNITDNTALTVAGTSSFTTSANNADITLNNTNALTGAVALNTTGGTGHATIDNGTTALNVAASSVGGNLTLTSGNVSGITDSGTVTVGGNLATTTDANNGVINMGTLAVNGTVAVNTNGSGNATVVNDAD